MGPARRVHLSHDPVLYHSRLTPSSESMTKRVGQEVVQLIAGLPAPAPRVGPLPQLAHRHERHEPHRAGYPRRHPNRGDDFTWHAHQIKIIDSSTTSTGRLPCSRPLSPAVLPPPRAQRVIGCNSAWCTVEPLASDARTGTRRYWSWASATALIDLTCCLAPCEPTTAVPNGTSRMGGFQFVPIPNVHRCRQNARPVAEQGDRRDRSDNLCERGTPAKRSPR
jgi:hypothetical protein